MSFWDLLRPITQIAWDLNSVVECLAVVLSLSILVVSVLAYRRKGSRRLLFVTAAFFLFTLKWVFKFVDQSLAISPGFFFSRASEGLLELVILALLFFAIFKK